MVNSFQLPRTLLVYAIAIPLALILGFFLVAPESLATWMLVGVTVFVGLTPLLLKHHHSAMILTWCALINVFFLPGQPPFWLFMAALSFGISLFAGIIRGKRPFLSAPGLAWPMIYLAIVVVATAVARGGIGARALGGASYGAKSYMLILGGIIGYFALTGQVISKKQAGWLTAAFFASTATALFSNLAYALGPSYWFLFNFFRPEVVLNEAMQDYGGAVGVIQRIEGLSVVSIGFYSFLLIRYGVRGLFDFRRPWRMVLFLLTIVASLFGGYRSSLVWFALLFALQLFWEKLLRWQLVVMLGLGLIAGGIILNGYINKMPLSIQRAFSFLPLDIDQKARHDATASTEWRVNMWHLLIPQIPKYLLVGKGYSIDPMDLYLTQESVKRGLAKDYEPHMLVGNYHSGPLSTIIPVGIWGAIGLIWLFAAGLNALYRNYKYGDPELRRINTFLLTWFTARAIFFLLVFGAFNTELYMFAGILGLSVSINGGVRSKPAPQTTGVSQPTRTYGLIAQPI